MQPRSTANHVVIRLFGEWEIPKEPEKNFLPPLFLPLVSREFFCEEKKYK